jgi:hypothetical protein
MGKSGYLSEVLIGNIEKVFSSLWMGGSLQVLSVDLKRKGRDGQQERMGRKKRC